MQGNIKTVAILGSSGFLGKALINSLKPKGYRIVRLTREISDENKVEKFLGSLNIDVFINLAGRNLLERRWSYSQKKALYESRVNITKYFCEAFANLDKPPKVILSASAIGYYGDREDEKITEHSKPGSGFLSELCRCWEDATLGASKAGIRVCNLRFGLVLDPSGGMLKKILLPYKLGVGGKLGTGEHYMSWVSLLDAIRAIEFLLENNELEGPFNICSPTPELNKDFSKILAQALNRPNFLTVPKGFLKLVLGEIAEEMLLSGAQVLPERLLKHGFEFEFPKLKNYLKAGL